MISKWKQPWLYGCKFIFFPHFDEYYIAGKPIKLPCLLGDKLYTHQLTNLQVSSCKLSSWGLAYYKLFLPYGCLTKFFVIPGAHWQSAWGFTKSAKKKILREKDILMRFAWIFKQCDENVNLTDTLMPVALKLIFPDRRQNLRQWIRLMNPAYLMSKFDRCIASCILSVISMGSTSIAAFCVLSATKLLPVWSLPK